MVSVDLSDGEVIINQCCSRRSESPVKLNTVGDFVFGEELFVKLNVIRRQILSSEQVVF